MRYRPEGKSPGWLQTCWSLEEIVISIAVVTRLTGTTQDSPTQFEDNAAHEAEQGEDTQQGQHGERSAMMSHGRS